MNTFSFSKISTYKECPLKYKYRYIDKIPSKPSVHLIKGSKVHKLLENYENSTAGEYSEIVRNFAESELGQEILSKPSIREHKIKLNADLRANDELKKHETRFIGFIDRINVDGGVDLIDFKTGKYKEPKYQDFEQLILYSLYMFDKFDICEIKLRFVYVEHNIENTLIFKRESADFYRTQLKADIEKIENDSEFKKCPGPLCPWCDYRDLCNSTK